MPGPMSDPVPAERPEADRQPDLFDEPLAASMREVRAETDCQPDLFDERGGADIRPSPEVPARPAPLAATLPDDDLIGRLLDAGPSEIDAFCGEIAARSLSAAVPSLEALWRRFHGFGIHSPLREQRAVVETLARLEGPEARAALRRIVLSPGLPEPLQPTALRAAADAWLVLPAPFVEGFLGHTDAAVRGAAFDLAPAAKVPAQRLRDGLSDGVASIRCTTAVALACQGDASGRDVLVAALANAPSTAIVEALGAIGDDEAIVALGRCAMRHSAHAPEVIAVLRDMGNPRADRLAARLEADNATPIAGNAP